MFTLQMNNQLRMVESIKKLTFCIHNYAVLWWGKCKTAYCELYLIACLHCVVRITCSIHFHTIRLVLHLLCYVHYVRIPEKIVAMALDLLS